MELPKFKKREKKEVKKYNRQSNYLTNSYFPFTQTESNLFAVMISRLESNKFDYEFTISSLYSQLNLKENNYQQMIQAFEGLLNKTIKFDYKGNEGEERQRQTNILDNFSYVKSENDIRNDSSITIRLAYGITPHLFNLKSNFTSYQLDAFLSLKSTYAKKLYTLFAEFKTTGRFITTKDNLQKVLGTNYSDFRDLMKVIKKIVKEIEEKTNINDIRINPIKKGRTIINYEFLFDWKNPQLQIPYKIPVMDTEQLQQIDTLVDKYQLSKSQAMNVVSHLPLKEIKKTLYNISLLMLDNQIVNVGGYTVGVFSKKFNIEI